MTEARAAAGPRAAPTGRSLTLGLLALDGAMLASIAGPIDLIGVAQKLAQLRDPQRAPQLRSVLLGARGQTQMSASGHLLHGVQHDVVDPDVVLVPGFMHGSGRDVLDKLAASGPEIELLRQLHGRGVRLVGACCSAFLLAEAGLLDGRRATTSWWLDSLFRDRYPRVQLDIEQTVVEDGPVATSGASSAVLDYVLRLIGRSIGEELAQQTARMLLLDPDRQSQAPYISLALRERPRHSLSERAEHFLQQSLHRPLSVAELAGHCGTSERSLHRHFRSHYGVAPLEHIQHLRVERAKALLESTHLSFDEVVERCGYSDVSSFRKLFKRATSMTPADYRERFRLRAH
jgi:transcriptional regulator GlxA family with amidase domain